MTADGIGYLGPCQKIVTKGDILSKGDPTVIKCHFWLNLRLAKQCHRPIHVSQGDSHNILYLLY